MKEKYNTHAATVTSAGVIMYCYDDKKVDILELIKLENHAFWEAKQRQYRLFMMYHDIPEIEQTQVGYN